MALDIRLDFVSDIDPRYVEKMVALRGSFIALDDMLKMLADEANAEQLPAAQRSIALARTYNEQALQMTIKTLCILGEIKE